MAAQTNYSRNKDRYFLGLLNKFVKTFFDFI